jgi:hypothetical protein
MLAGTVSPSVPFESLVEAIKDLNLDEKYRLWELLEEQIAQAEEDKLEQDSSTQAQMESARKEHQAGDYETIDEYVARRKERSPLLKPLTST